MTLHSNLAQAPVLLKKVPLDTSRDLVPIAALSTGVGVGVMKKDLPVASLKELTAETALVLRDGERVPLAAGGMHLVSTLLEGNGEGAVIDRQETLIMIEASDPQRQALLTLDSNWGWDLTPPPPPTPPTT